MTAPRPRVVLHFPHASLAVPLDIAGAFLLTAEQLERELLVMTDRYTDELFALPSSIATSIAFPVSRLVVDPERFTNDAREPMARNGMGVIYTRTAGDDPLRPLPSADESAGPSGARDHGRGQARSVHGRAIRGAGTSLPGGQGAHCQRGANSGHRLLRVHLT
jgi:hypothetical protein